MIAQLSVAIHTGSCFALFAARNVARDDNFIARQVAVNKGWQSARGTPLIYKPKRAP